MLFELMFIHNTSKRQQKILGCQLLFFLLKISFVKSGCRDQPHERCESICITDDPSIKDYRQWNCTIRAVVNLPSDDGLLEVSLPKVLPVLRLAEEQIKKDQLLPSFVKIQWISYDDKCDASVATINAMDGHGKDCAHVLFGPACDYPLASVSRIVKYFHAEGTPLISNGGFTYDFVLKKTDCSNEFYMLIRTGMLSYLSISNLMVSVFNRYSWDHAVFFYERDGQFGVGGRHTCHLMMSTLAHSFRNQNITFSSSVTEMTGNLTEELKREVGFDNSIIIMCADPQSIRQIMLAAEELNMIDTGEYVFFSIELYSNIRQKLTKPWEDKSDTHNNERARKAYTALLTVSAKQPDDEQYYTFSEKVKSVAAKYFNYTFAGEEPVSTFVTTFFDAVLLYAHALNESITRDPMSLTRPMNGTEIHKLIRNRSFEGITGNVTINENGDRLSAYSLLDMNPDTGKFEIVADYFLGNLDLVGAIHWPGGRTDAPPDTPECGYDGSLCPDNSLPGYAILSLFLGFTVILMIIVSYFGYRHYKSEAEINSMSWKISWHEVMLCDPASKLRGSLHSLAKRDSQVTLYSDELGVFSAERQLFISVGFYKGCKVAIKKIDPASINLNRSLMLELKKMKDLQHDHLVKFYGACLDLPKCCVFTEYCPKGSLQDILENEQINLDWMFRLSLMHDIVRGMHFLHQTDIKSHGTLKSSNCVVDSRFVVKITDFGMHQLRKCHANDDVENSTSHAYWKKLLWTAPELLRIQNLPPNGTQKGDVYSFGIIVHEIVTRQGPFYLGGANDKSPKEIVELVKMSLSPAFRPHIDDREVDDIKNIMERCWADDPYERPDFHFLKTTIRKINKDNETGNIVDNLLKRLEQYTRNLEGLVEERTHDYLEEKKKCEKLLYQLLPLEVAAQLIAGKPVVAETYDQVTIYFSDIVGFTAISAESTPMEVVGFLNDLYTCFDSIVENFDVYKVETIGDAYMVVSGLTVTSMRNGNQHALEIARLALALLQAVKNFVIRHRPNDKLKLRIGLHSGPCVAGVVGQKMPRYCLFGDTVNTASRMESNGQALKIHISHSTKELLDQIGSFNIVERGYVEMKGKGEMLTYWLEGENAETSSDTEKSSEFHYKTNDPYLHQIDITAKDSPLRNGGSPHVGKGNASNASSNNSIRQHNSELVRLNNYAKNSGISSKYNNAESDNIIKTNNKINLKSNICNNLSSESDNARSGKQTALLGGVN